MSTTPTFPPMGFWHQVQGRVLILLTEEERGCRGGCRHPITLEILGTYQTPLPKVSCISARLSFRADHLERPTEAAPSRRPAGCPPPQPCNNHASHSRELPPAQATSTSPPLLQAKPGADDRQGDETSWGTASEWGSHHTQPPPSLEGLVQHPAQSYPPSQPYKCSAGSLSSILIPHSDGMCHCSPLHNLELRPPKPHPWVSMTPRLPMFRC